MTCDFASFLSRCTPLSAPRATLTIARRWQNDAVIAEEVAAAFGWGEPVAAMTEEARGWGGHDIVYRLDTTDGRWAVKAVFREVDGLIRERFDIELAAFDGGLRMPRPVPSVDGSPYVDAGETRLCCHGWVDGVAKVNEEFPSVRAGSWVVWSAEFTWDVAWLFTAL